MRRQAIVILVGILIASLLIIFTARHYVGLQRAAAQNEVRGGVMVATDDGIKRSVEVDEAQAAYNAGLAQARSEFERAIAEGKRNEPATRINADSTNPGSVRAAARARRIARERLGCAGSECP